VLPGVRALGKRPENRDLRNVPQDFRCHLPDRERVNLMKQVRMRRLTSAALKVGFAVAVVVSVVSPCAAGDPKVTAATQVWRVVDTATGATYYAQSIEAGWFAVGGFTSGMGTVTYAPTQTPQASHIESGDSWQAGSTVAGAIASWKGKQSGFAAITADGVQNPPAPSGKGYISVKFRDLQTKKPVTISKFVADKVKVGEVQGLLPKKR
jgi:hypothetical protein